MQAGLYWATGQPFFGIKPVRALKVLIVQVENDQGDVAEQLQGVVRGVKATGDIAEAELQQAIERNLVIERVIGRTGKRFLGVLDSLIGTHKPNLLFIDPLFAVAGCDLKDAQRVGEFLREGLIPIAVRNKLLLNVIHHVGKPARENDGKQSWSEVDFQYLGFGSSEIQNVFRAVNILLPVAAHEGVYRLILSKRGSRAGALDVNGEPSTSLYLSHAKTGICWEQVEKPESGTRFKQKFTAEHVLEHLSITEGATTGAIKKRVTEESGMSSRTFYELWAELKSEQKIRVDSEGLWVRK